MRPYKIGQVAKFHTPLPDENPDQLYVAVEIIEDVERPRAMIKALHTGYSFTSINTVLLDDLEVVEVNTNDLIGQNVTITKADDSEATGTVARVREQRIVPDLTKGENGVYTNVLMDIQDENGKEHTGMLFVDKNIMDAYRERSN